MPVNEQSLVDFISRIHPLLDTKQVRSIAALFELKELSKGGLFVKEGEQSDAYCYIVEGLMRSYTFNRDGEEVTTGLYPPGTVACDLVSFFRRVPARESYVVLAEGLAWFITFPRLQQAFHALPEFREFGRALLVSEYAMLKSRSLAGLHQTAEERYAELVRSTPEIIQQVPLKHIASYLGVTDTSLSRIRKEFARK